MNKPLSEMTLEELWELFPIILSEHKSCWQDWYEEEKRAVAALLPDQNIKIHHIGSTAIPNIWAKPIIDILVEVPRKCNLSNIKDLLVDNGYICMSWSNDRISFNKGYTEHGFADRVFHLHLRYVGDNDELYFRDYLIEHTDISDQYEEMKLKLWKKYEYNRDAYTDAKTEFIRKWTSKARKIYYGRY